ncbi:MAG: CopG family ribbon-helix-helix protein [Euryarchaeota archaeon]|nr:CopG family ribbon-helix-helix protein [Euryarchaeota archaeon]
MGRTEEDRLRVVSVSLPDSLLQKVDRSAQEHGYKGRSELVRAGIARLFQSFEEEKVLKGNMTCTVTLYYDHEAQSDVAKLLHEHQPVIKSLVHNHLSEEECLEQVVLKGAGEQIDRLINRLRTLAGVHVVAPVPLPKRSGAQDDQTDPVSTG